MLDTETRTKHRRGEGVPSAKLTEQQVIAIRADARGCRRLAKEYKVAMSTVRAIRKGDTWKHIGAKHD